MEIEKGDIIQVCKVRVKSMQSEPEEYLETYIVGKIWADNHITAISAENGEITVFRREQCQFRLKGGKYLEERLFNTGGF